MSHQSGATITDSSDPSSDPSSYPAGQCGGNGSMNEKASTSRMSTFLAPRIAESSRMKSKITLRANSAKSQLCGHCNLNLSLKTFKKHKRLYYCNSDGKWLLSTDKDLYQDITSKLAR